MPIPRGFPYGLSRYRAKTHLNTSHDLRMTPFSASPNGVGARRAWLSFGDVGFSGLLVSGSFSGLLVFLAWLWCGCLFFWFFLLGLSFCVFLCPGFVGSGFFGSVVSAWSGSGFREEGAPWVHGFGADHIRSRSAGFDPCEGSSSRRYRVRGRYRFTRVARTGPEGP